MRRFGTVAILLAAITLAASAPSAATFGPSWSPTDASSITSSTDGHQVTTAAIVDLKMCYEAQLQPLRMKFAYQVVAARIPGTEGKVCGLSIRKATVSISEAGSPKTVTVKTASGTTSSSVSTAGAVVTF